MLFAARTRNLSKLMVRPTPSYGFQSCVGVKRLRNLWYHGAVRVRGAWFRPGRCLRLIHYVLREATQPVTSHALTGGAKYLNTLAKQGHRRIKRWSGSARQLANCRADIGCLRGNGDDQE